MWSDLIAKTPLKSAAVVISKIRKVG